MGKEVARRRREGKFVWPHLALQQKLFDRLVFAKIRDVFGGRIRFFISGSAPLNRDIAEWFEAAGVLILEGYGLTESSGAGFINRPDNYKLGTVGLPFEGTEVRISDAGEVQFRSDCVMAGYHHLDDATAEALKRRRLAVHRRSGQARRRRLPDDHRPDQGTVQAVQRQVRRAAGDRGEVRDAVPVRQPVHGVRRGTQLRRRAGHPG